MPSPVDPSRRRALAAALHDLAYFATADAVAAGTVDLKEVVYRLTCCDGDEELAQAIEAGEYGPYQETDEPGAAV
jgi:hypothetical protein